MSTHSPLARIIALADDPMALIQQCEAYRLCFCAALERIHEDAVEIARLQRMIADMREERARYAREAFGAQGAESD